MISNDAESREWMLQRVKALEEAISEKGLDESDLDELVHDCSSEQASETNNSGVSAQLHFLLHNGWKPEDILGRLGIEKEKAESYRIGFEIVRAEEKAPMPISDKWITSHDLVHELWLECPMDKKTEAINAIYDAGGRIVRGGPKRVEEAKVDLNIYQAHAFIPVQVAKLREEPEG